MTLLTAFSGAASGQWRVVSVTAVIGEGLPTPPALSVAPEPAPSDALWTLRGRPSNIRYAGRAEVTALRAVQEGLDRPRATAAALIPITKSAAWWELPQDERLDIFTAQSRHNAIGLDYLPAVARRLYHSRDYGESFDFLTWFEFAPEDEPAFDRLVERLRATPEWGHVTREVDIRLRRA